MKTSSPNHVFSLRVLCVCVARAAGKPSPFPGGAGCELPYSQLEASALAELGGLQAPGVCRVGPLVAPARATALGLRPNSRGGGDSAQPRCCLSRRGTRILRSAGAPQASLEPSPVPQGLSALWSWWWRALERRDLGRRQEGPLFFLTQSHRPHRRLGFGSGREGEPGFCSIVSGQGA